MQRIQTPSMGRSLSILALAVWLVGCSDGVSVQSAAQGGSTANGFSDQSVAPLVNDPANTLNEPQVRDWIGAVRSNASPTCGLLSQDADDAYATDSFERRVDTDGGIYFQATRPESRDTPEYIEFCLDADKLARYRIKTVVRAPSLLEDSFFVTIDEDEANPDSTPGIYDVAGSVDSFKNDLVKTRVESPLEIVLEAGRHTIRFYFREPNTAIKSVSLEAQADGGTYLDPAALATDFLAQCAANTGLSVEDIEMLLDTYLGDAPRVFVLHPFEINSGYLRRDDWRWDVDSRRGTVMCLSDPGEGRRNLVDNTITVDRIVFGSAGIDMQYEPTAVLGTFIGNAGADMIDIVRGGTVIGGEGDDWIDTFESGRVEGGTGNDAVGIMLSGQFVGNKGADTVDELRGGRFDGGQGNDAVDNHFSGFFDGGPGTDSVTNLSGGARIDNVENVGGLFESLPAPTDIELVEATEQRILVRWVGAIDLRIDGYDVDHGLSALEDPGPQISYTPPSFSTTRTVAMLSGFRGANAVSVRAYDHQSDGSYLYSLPLRLEFSSPSVQTLLESRTVLASAINEEANVGAGRAENGTVVVGSAESFPLGSGSLFTRYGASLQSPESVFDALIQADSYEFSYAHSRQYVHSDIGDGTRITAYDGDVRNQLWQQDLALSKGPSEFFSYFRCDSDHVTQDDWLICIGLGGGIHGFSPTGDSRPLSVDLDYYSSLVDGDKGRVVQLNDEVRQPLKSMSVVDLNAGTLTIVDLDFSGRLEAGNRVGAQGLAVRGDTVIIAGGVFDDTCRVAPDCYRFTSEALGYFLARVSIDTGVVLDYREYSLEDRPGEGVGQFVGDTVVFSASAPLTRHHIETLEGIERAFIPGIVADVSATSILTEVLIREPSVQFSEFYLLEP